MRQSDAFMVLSGIVILVIFTYISAVNVFSSDSSNSYFAKDDTVRLQVNNISLENGKLTVEVNNSAYVCAKQTKSTPSESSICFKQTENNMASFSVYEGKTYYIWLKDEYNNMSDYIEYNTNTKQIN